MSPSIGQLTHASFTTKSQPSRATMAANKDRSLPTRKEAIGKRPWPNLPQHVLNLLARKPNLLEQISFPGTTKSWTTTTRRCTTTKHPQHPRLCDLEPEASKWCSLSKTLPQFVNIYFRTENYPRWYYGESPPQFWTVPTPHFVGYYKDLLVTRGPNPSDFLIHHVSTRICWQLPPWDITIPFKFIAQTSSTMVVVTGVSSPALVVRRFRKDGCMWIKQECNTIDPYDAKKQTMRFTNIIEYEDKLYALSLQGSLVVMEDVNSDIVITRIGPSRAVPSVSSSRYFKEHLFESKGEILLVFLIYLKTLDIVDQVEVFRLNFPRLSWIKVESLKERALFLEKECCIWVDSSETNCRRNSVYFTQNVANEWYTYDMETACISPIMNIANNW